MTALEEPEVQATERRLTSGVAVASPGGGAWVAVQVVPGPASGRPCWLLAESLQKPAVAQEVAAGQATS